MAPHPLKFEQLEERIIKLREQPVLLDADVAELYDVETRDINKAVANNPDKFSEGYVAQLSKREKTELVENFHQFHRLKHSTVNPKAFPEKGLYMLATILKSSGRFRPRWPSSRPLPRSVSWDAALRCSL